MRDAYSTFGHSPSTYVPIIRPGRQINSSMNRGTKVCGVDYRLACGIAAGSIVIFLFGSHALALVLLPLLLVSGRVATRREPKMFRLLVLSFLMSAYYDPSK